MLAAFYTKQGAARDVLAVDEFNMPHPGRGEVRIRLAASGVNPADVKRRAGAPFRPMVYPVVIPHSDGAGWVDAIGPNVAPLREGDRVWTWNAQWGRAFGTAAEYVVLPQEQVVPLPASVPLEGGAALGVPALTAHRCLSVLGRLRSRSVLVFGAAGAIGQIALQLARAAGAVPCAAVSSEQKCEVARRAGAEQAFNLRSPGFVQEARRWVGARGFDCIVDVDLAANASLYLELLRRSGAVSVYGSATNMAPSLNVLAWQKHGVSVHFISGADQPPPARRKAIGQIGELLADARLVPPPVEPFRLEDIAAAHERVEAGGLVRKVVLALQAGAPAR